MTDLSIIRERHQPDRPDGFQSCKTCIHFEPHEYDPTPDEWPCDVRIVLDALDGAAAAERERLRKEVQMLPMGYVKSVRVDVLPRDVVLDLLADPEAPSDD